MFAENLNTRLLAALERPDLRVVAGDQRIVFDATLDSAFRADPEGQVVLGAACLGDERICAFHIRHALELSMLLDAAIRLAADGGGTVALDLPILAGLCAARVAARFWLLDAAPADAEAPPAPSWLGAMAGSAMPASGTLGVVWARIRHLQGSAYRLHHAERRGQDDSIVPDGVMRMLAACWDLLGPTETLMATGGDARLAIDPRTGLNHYGCSHRPRPWAVTFASSTASSLSERGFAGAEAARKRVAMAALAGRLPEALVHETERVRDAIGRHHGLADSSGIVLSASGTDSEMAALAVCCLADASGMPIRRPVSNVLLAPEETGAGVPLAAAGRHFASDTARGRPVSKGGWIAGFPIDTRVLSVPIRDGAGGLLPPADVDAACIRLAEAEAETGRTVLLHRLDLSKTGLLAPSLDCLETLQARLGRRLEVVVDACQARLDRRRVQDYIARGWMVMITGSKFFGGPGFSGALLLPRARFPDLSLPPAGLAAYGLASCEELQATACANAGLVLRWRAALAEMARFRHAAPGFGEVVDRLAAELRRQLAADPDLLAIDPPEQVGPAAGWAERRTVFTFALRESGRLASVERLRALHDLLNRDLSAELPDADPALAAALCQVGQPVLLGSRDGHAFGGLRIAIGARHAETAEHEAALQTVFAKLRLVRRLPMSCAPPPRSEAAASAK